MECPMFQPLKVTLILASLVFLVATIQPAEAVPSADYYVTVDTTVDDPALSACTLAINDCSLRGAINYANSILAYYGHTVTITLPAGTYNLTHSGTGEDNNATGDLDVLWRGLTLVGAGPTTIIGGGGLDRVLQNYGDGLEVKHLKISGGRAPSGQSGGGGIQNWAGAILHLYDVVIQQNEVDGSVEYLDGGGGIANLGTMLLESSLITGNDACKGGGIILAGARTVIRDSTISGNTATITEGSCGYGGGIGMYNGDVYTLVVNTTIENNTALRGGGMFYAGQDGQIIDTTFIDNESAYYGGAIFNLGQLTLSHSTISGNNTLYYGGGVFNDGTLSIQNVTFYGNSSKNGGGLGIFTDNSTNIDHCTFSGNTVSEGGASVGTLGVGTIFLHNTILASTDTGNTCMIGAGNTFNDLGYNLNTDDSCGLDELKHDQLNISPQLQSLASNGGPTQTMALNSGSPAIDKADPDVSQSKDQRGYYRPVDGPDPLEIATSDIGAYEYGSFLLNPFAWLPLVLKAP
jgi:fibronectin-binding autotransporter adhesin